MALLYHLTLYIMASEAKLSYQGILNCTVEFLVILEQREIEFSVMIIHCREVNPFLHDEVPTANGQLFGYDEGQPPNLKSLYLFYIIL